MKRILLFIGLFSMLLFCENALAAKARSISSNADSAYHAEHLKKHLGESTCQATGNYIKTRSKANGSKVIGHLEQADEFILLDISNGWAQIEVILADKNSPDSQVGMTGWVNSDYIDCLCSSSNYENDNLSDLIPQYPPSLPHGWTFSSGVGAWSTDLRINSDGSFYGYYHDADGLTLYESYFNGHLSDIKKLNTYTYSMVVSELQVNGVIGYQYYHGDIQHTITEPAGIRQGDTLCVYTPGAERSWLSDEHLSWLHGVIENPLNSYALCNLSNGSAFDPGSEFPENTMIYSPSAITDYQCNANNLRIRNSPNGSKILGHLEKDDQFIVTATVDGWAHIFITHSAITSPDSWAGLSGWVSSDYIGKRNTSQSDSSWKNAYLQYLTANDLLRNIDDAEFWFVFVDNDSIPELVIDTGIIAGGCHLLTYHNGIVDATLIACTGIVSYIEKGNLLLESAGHQGNYHDIVYTIKNGKWVTIYQAQNYEYPSPTYDIDQKIIHTYHIDNQEVTREAYYSTRNSYFDNDRATKLINGTSILYLIDKLK